MAKYDEIGLDYNSTRTADPWLTERLRCHLKPKPQCTYLDIGCGTGNYTIALQEEGTKFIGIDPAQSMLSIAEKKSTSISWKKGSAESIPLPDNAVDGIIGTLTMHHWADLHAAFKDLKRVCSSGTIVLFTSSSSQMEGYWLNHYFPEMLMASAAKMPEISVIIEAMQAADFVVEKTEPYFVREDLEDLFLYAGKHRPLFYIDSEIRKGISSFSDLANTEEVEEGIMRLKFDIATGEIEQVMRRYQNEDGDYMFIVGSC